METPIEIHENHRMWLYFKDCEGAIDGTHLPMKVSAEYVARFRGCAISLEHEITCPPGIEQDESQSLAGDGKKKGKNANPNAKGLCGKKIDMIDELAIVFSNDQATGEWACLGKDINANSSRQMNDSDDEYTPIFDLNENTIVDDLGGIEGNGFAHQEENANTCSMQSQPWIFKAYEMSFKKAEKCKDSCRNNKCCCK
ncbi:unnamed protein product [Ilex paraguariensis]|uniref:Uncharacterized protein n=1 Tax=Ilex paraguariensis TaxID=185542 RepID=A0ABC8QXM7_9AQUA